MVGMSWGLSKELQEALERAVAALEQIAEALDRPLEPVSGGVVLADEHRIVYESPNGMEAVCACGHRIDIHRFTISMATIAGGFADHLNQIHEEKMLDG